MHKLLSRQLRTFGGSAEKPPCDWQGVVQAINAAYRQSDSDRELLERSLEITSQEMLSRFRELQRSEARSQALLDAIPDLVLRWRNDGQILDFRATTTIGVSNAETAVGRSLAEVLGAEVARALLRRSAEVLAGAGREPFEYQANEQGDTLYYEARLVPSGPDEVVAIVRNVTEHRQLQTRLLVADRMASVGTLAAGVAHEINNPLAYIIANMEYISEVLPKVRDGAADANPDEVEMALEEAREGADRVRVIVNDLKAFTREKAVSGPVVVDDVLQSSIRMAWNELRHSAKVVRDFRPVLPVQADESRLGQVFLNLLVNAAQALPVGQADTNEIRISTYMKGGRVIIEFADTGPGIPSEIQARIFDPFFTTKPVGSGTGLGLFICQSIVQSFDGEITVESSPGNGAVFRVSLKPSAATPAAITGLSRPTIAPQVRCGRILVVDDERQVARSVKRALEAHHEVVCVTTATDALNLLRQQPFDLIVCDLMMPETSGMDFYATIGRELPALQLKIVFLTGGAFSQDARDFVDRVSNIVMEKPFSTDELRRIVAMMLATRTVRSVARSASPRKG